MNGTNAIKDAVISGVAGLGATKVMSMATTAFYERQSEQAKRREQEASSGVAYTVAAQKTAKLAGVELSERATQRAGTALHYGLGIGWVPVYLLLRRKWRMTPVGAGLTAGLGMAVVVDEVANPVLGFTAPPRAYPIVTHLRGLAGHVVYGVSLAILVEVGLRLMNRR